MTHMLCSLAGGKVVVALEVRGRANLGRFLKLTGLSTGWLLLTGHCGFVSSSDEDYPRRYAPGAAATRCVRDGDGDNLAGCAGAE